MNFVAKCCQPPGILGDFAVDRWKFIGFTRPGESQMCITVYHTGKCPLSDSQMAIVAQLVERLTCNWKVGGSNPAQAQCAFHQSWCKTH